MCLMLSCSTLFAMDNTGKLDLSVGYASAPENRVGLEKDLSAANGNAKVSCADVVIVHTGGTMATATAGRCSISGQAAVWACRNDMLGSTAVGSDDARVSDGLNLTYLIATQCVGG